MTAFYSWRLIYKTFHGAPHDPHHYEAARESPLVILVPLGVLAIGSLGAGFAFKEFFAGHEVEHFFRESLKQGHIIEEMHNVPLLVAWLPTAMMALGWGIAAYMYLLHRRSRRGSRASTTRCTASCSTSGTSTSCTT